MEKGKFLILRWSALIIFSLVLCISCKKGEKSEVVSNPNQTSILSSGVQEEPISVKVIEAQRGELCLRLSAPAEAVAERKITIKAEVSGIIKKLYVREGQHVQANELLVEIEDTPYRLQLQQKEATRLRTLSELFLEQRFSEPSKPLSPEMKEKLRIARENYEKAASLLGQGLISIEQYDKLKREYEFLLLESGEMKQEVMAAAKGLTQSEIDVQIAKLQLEKTKIKAPFAGIITNIRVSSQENIEIGRELFTLVDMESIKVVARVLESEIGRVRPGQEVEIKFVSYPNQRYKGKVEAVSPLIDPEDKTCQVHIAISNPKKEIKPGMHAEVEIAAIVLKDRLLIPQKAVLIRGGRKLVFVVEGELAKWRYLETGAENESFIEILDGVKEGEKVIVEGHLTLAHDARVKIENNF
ncbi:MAG: efflux RND transporter periplasmic adaptor subunit [Candidatus Aminicenantes bacterium]|nr:efflux RND transporter periplasmic adaptor subunit [Candidatus Aminicenantes bacterium]